MKQYKLNELVSPDIDAWVEAIGWVSDTPEGRQICPEDECPAEYETELTELSNRNGWVFDENGKPLQEVDGMNEDDEEEKIFEVKIAETYTKAFCVYARNASEAQDIVDEAINCGEIDTLEDYDDYDRECVNFRVVVNGDFEWTDGEQILRGNDEYH